MDTVEEVLYTDASGRRQSSWDVAADGLDGGLAERIPRLLEILEGGELIHRIDALLLLVSWGEPSAMETALRWSSDPAARPWKQAVVHHRLFPVDGFWEMLAEALYTSLDNEPFPGLREHQIALARALLAIHHEVYFDRSLASALCVLIERGADLGDALHSALDRSLARIGSPEAPPFDHAFQAATLLLPLASIDDDRTASVGRRLIAEHPDNLRMCREVLTAWANGSGPATAAALRELSHPGLSRERAGAMRRRGI